MLAAKTIHRNLAVGSLRREIRAKLVLGSTALARTQDITRFWASAHLTKRDESIMAAPRSRCQSVHRPLSRADYTEPQRYSSRSALARAIVLAFQQCAIGFPLKTASGTGRDESQDDVAPDAINAWMGCAGPSPCESVPFLRLRKGAPSQTIWLSDVRTSHSPRPHILVSTSP